jgi:hypothetical protein
MNKLLPVLVFVACGHAYAQWSTNSSTVYYNGGSVGIGTSTPSNIQGWDRVFNVEGANHSKILATSFGQTYRVGLYAHPDWVPGGVGVVGTESNHPLGFATNYTIRMLLNTNGYLGIGTVSPVAKLHINSPIERETLRIYKEGNATNYLNIWQGTGGAALDPIGTGKLYLGYDQTTDVYMGNSTGKVGVGTSTPEQKLDVRGNMVLESGTSPVFYTGTGTSELNRHLLLINSTNYGSASGLKAGGILVADSYNYANPGKNDLIVKGNVGIGTTTPGSFKLAVEGKIGAREVNVTTAAWSDYVFQPAYQLRSLAEVDQFIKRNHHLPDVPSESEVLKNGQDLGEMNAILLRKIEELTLYMIELKKSDDQTRYENQIMKQEIQQLKNSKH